MPLSSHRKKLPFEERDKYPDFRLAKAKALWRLKHLGYEDAPIHDRGHLLSCMGYPAKWITYILNVHPNDERKVLKWDTASYNIKRQPIRMPLPKVPKHVERKLIQQIR